MQGSFKNWSVAEILKAFHREWQGMRNKHENIQGQLSSQNADLRNLWRSHEELRMTVAQMKDDLEVKF